MMWILISIPFWFSGSIFFITGLLCLVIPPEDENETMLDRIISFIMGVAATIFTWSIAARLVLL